MSPRFLVPNHVGAKPAARACLLWLMMVASLSSALCQTPDAPVGSPPATSPGLEPSAESGSSPPSARPRTKRSRSSSSDPELYQFGSPVTIPAGETRRSVVVIQSSATVDGHLEQDLVVIGGTARINGTVDGDVVNVGGGIRLGPEAHVGGNAVGVLGGIRLATNATVNGDAVGIGGGVTLAQGAQVNGQVVDQRFPMPNASWWNADGLTLPPWIATTFKQLVLKARLLSFRVGWVWWVAAGFLGLHLLLALGAPGVVRSVSEILEQRGATAFLMGLLALPLGALLALLLIATGIGIIVIPFMGAAFLLAAVLGKAGLLHHLGAVIARNRSTTLRPAGAVLLGTLPVTAVYLIPFAGVFFWAVLSMWALGGAWLALLHRFRREAPSPASRPPGPPHPPASASSPSAPVASGDPQRAMAAVQKEAMPPTTSSAVSEGLPEPVLNPTPPALGLGLHGGGVGPSPAPVPPLDLLALPRIGLKQRLFATVIDWAILLIAMEWIGLHGARWKLVGALAYFAGFWIWRQTTLGGVVMQLRVARLDGRPVDAPTAVIRAVGALFGGLILGLGYFWSAWDPERQGWHDKIAGTVVVRTPRSQPLL